MAFPFAEKLSEKEKPETTQFTCHRYNARIESVSDALRTRFYNLQCYTFVSIDPAINNMGLYIEKRYSNGYVQTIQLDKGSFKASTDPNACSSLYLEVMIFLDKYRQYYQDCHFVIIERQFKYQSARVMQQIISYFMTIARDLPNQPFIIEMDSKVRLKQLKCPAGMNRQYQKKWVVETAYFMFKQRGDKYAIDFLDNMKTKKDDVCDAVLQVEAFCKLVGNLPLTKVILTQIPIQSYLPQQPSSSSGNFVLCMDDEISYFS